MKWTCATEPITTARTATKNSVTKPRPRRNHLSPTARNPRRSPNSLRHSPRRRHNNIKRRNINLRRKLRSKRRRNLLFNSPRHTLPRNRVNIFNQLNMRSLRNLFSLRNRRSTLNRDNIRNLRNTFNRRSTRLPCNTRPWQIRPCPFSCTSGPRYLPTQSPRCRSTD